MDGLPVNLIAYPPSYLYQPTYEWQRKVEFDFFAYVFPTFTALAAAASQQQQIIIQNDSDFELRRIVYHADIAQAAYLSGTRPIPNYTLQILDSGSGRNLFSAAAPLGAIASSEDQTGGRNDLVWPKIFTRNSTIVATMTNFDAAVVTYSIRLVLLGRKIFVKD